MVEWRDKGLLLKVRPYGDASLIAHFLTAEHGRFAGLVRGNRANRQVLQPGTLCELNWRSRLDDQLGFFDFEVESTIAPRILDDPIRLTALLATVGLLDRTLAEREPAPGPFQAFQVWLETLETEIWGQTLVYLELGLLGHLGYGLRLEACTVTGATENLAYVSPKSGAAVSEEGAGPYRDKLLTLPPFLTQKTGKSETSTEQQMIDGLNLTGYFLHHRVFAVTNAGLPGDRQSLVEKIAREAGIVFGG